MMFPCAIQRMGSRVKLWARGKYLAREGADTTVPICHINLARNPKLRGGERQTEILVRELAVQGVLRQRVVVLQHGPLIRQFRGIPGLEICGVGNRLSALLACRGASLLHAHEAHATQVAYAASWFGMKYLVTRRITKAIRAGWFTRAMYRKALVVVALTEAVEDSLQSRIPGIPVVCIPSAWNSNTIDPSVAPSVRAQFPGKFIVGHIAAMDGKEKGHSVLLQAARILEPEFPNIQFLLLGGGRFAEEFHRQAMGLKNVHFAGWVESPTSWISAFDLFAFPSLSEALGSTLLDVLRAGVPIVASRVGGIPEVVTEDCGVLVPPNDANALAATLLHLHQSELLRQQFSQGGIARAEQYSPARMAKQYLKVYRSIGEDTV